MLQPVKSEINPEVIYICEGGVHDGGFRGYIVGGTFSAAHEDAEFTADELRRIAQIMDESNEHRD